MKTAIIAVVLALGVLGSIQNAEARMITARSQTFANLCDTLDSIALNGDKCITDSVTNVLKYFKSVNKRVKICADITDVARSQACYDGAVFDIDQFIRDAMKAQTDLYAQTKCSNTTFWGMFNNVRIWSNLSMWERSADLKEFATVTLPAFKSLGEVAPVAVAPAVAPVAAVSAAIPERPILNLL